MMTFEFIILMLHSSNEKGQTYVYYSEMSTIKCPFIKNIEFACIGVDHYVHRLGFFLNENRPPA